MPGMACHDDKESPLFLWLRRGCLLLVGAMMLVGLGRDLREGSEPYFNNDESRQIMTAVYWNDFLRVAPLSDPKGFTRAYYAHFPAIAPLHWPPMYHLFAASVFLATGPSVLVARLLTCGMSVALLVLIFCTIRQWYGQTAATLGAMLFVAIPLLKQLSSVFLLDVPLLLWMTAAIFVLGLFVRTGKPAYVWLTCGLMLLAGLTKQHSIILVPVFVCVAVEAFRREHWRCWHLYAATVLAALIAVTYYAIVLATITSSGQDFWIRQGSAWQELLKFVGQIGAVPAAAGALGVVFCLLRPRGWKENMCLVWMASVLLLFAVTGIKSSRYLIYMAPALLILSARAMAELLRRLPAQLTYAAILCMTVLAGWNALRADPSSLHGYQDAAQAAIRLSPHRPILFGGVYDGTFILYCRLANRDLSAVVLRGDKIAGGGNILPNRGYTPFVESYGNLAKIIRDTGVGIIVLEEHVDLDTQEHRWLWEYAARQCEELSKVNVTLPTGKASCVRVFRTLFADPGAEFVSMPMLTLQEGSIQCDLTKSLLRWH